MEFTSFESPYWNETVLSPEELLDNVEALDQAFVDVYRKSLAFNGWIVEGDYLGQVERAYVEFADTLAGGDINNIEEMFEGVWAGYHPIPLLFARLRWYGILGQFHYTDTKNASDSEALAGEIELAECFCQSLPNGWGELEGINVFREVLLAAQARLALDSGQSMTADQVAALAGMEKRSFKNALSRRGEAGLQADSDGSISHGEASRWLKARRNFIETVTYRPSDEQVEGIDSKSTEVQNREYEFVPVTDDGAAFLPDLRRTAGYQIGKYGQEVYIDDYFEALKRLQVMDTPRFRRPNVNGIPGIKVANGWQRVAVDDLRAAIAHQAT